MSEKKFSDLLIRVYLWRFKILMIWEPISLEKWQVLSNFPSWSSSCIALVVASLTNFLSKSLYYVAILTLRDDFVNRDLVVVKFFFDFFETERTTTFDMCNYSCKVRYHICSLLRKDCHKGYMKTIFHANSKGSRKNCHSWSMKATLK